MRDEDARATLQPLLLAHGVDAVERDGKLVFQNRNGRAIRTLTRDDLAEVDGSAEPVFTREPDAEMPNRVRLGFIEADGSYEVRAEESSFPDAKVAQVAESELPTYLDDEYGLEINAGMSY